MLHFATFQSNVNVACVIHSNTMYRLQLVNLQWNIFGAKEGACADWNAMIGPRGVLAVRSAVAVVARRV